MLRIPQLLVLTLLLLLPQGITGEVYSTGAAEIAGALGLSGDEASWLKTLNMMGQLMTLPLAAWLARRLGYRNMTRLGALIGLVAALLACAGNRRHSCSPGGDTGCRPVCCCWLPTAWCCGGSAIGPSHWSRGPCCLASC
ncbi:MFS transporter [Aeromonas sp. s3]|uniref:MFS transporter n=1 Tax=Aeromonas sp. s3 TaxID=3138485 RepID=UPI0034A532DF